MENKLTLINEKNLIVTGIKKALGISEASIVLELENTSIHICGENMEVKKLDVESGLLEVDGKILSIKYAGSREKISLIKRIFK